MWRFPITDRNVPATHPTQVSNTTPCHRKSRQPNHGGNVVEPRPISTDSFSAGKAVKYLIKIVRHFSACAALHRKVKSSNLCCNICLTYGGVIYNFVGSLTAFTAVNKKFIRRWDSEREPLLRRHRTRTTKYNRLVHKFRHRSTRLCVGTHVYKIRWNNAI